MSTDEKSATFGRSSATKSPTDFAAQYRQMLDSQLLQLAEEREDLIPEAVAALDVELTLRGISTKQARLAQSETVLSDAEPKCPVCGAIYNANWQAKLLYGQNVCASCYHSVWTRRVLAYFIDHFVITLAIPVVAVIAFASMHAEGWFAAALLFAVPVLIVLLYLFKDGRGLSVGKLLTGIEVIDVRRAKPAGYLASLKRNIPLLIPFVPIIIAFQVHAGPRLGDEWAHTRVVPRRYRDKSPFAASGSASVTNVSL